MQITNTLAIDPRRARQKRGIMSDDSDRAVVCSGAGLFTETATGRRAFVTFHYECADNGGMIMRMRRSDGCEFPWPLSSEEARIVGAFFFPVHSGDGRPSHALRDPVNIDGSPRNRLHDRLKSRRTEPESMAAD